jgi:protocatechuate 3,4-dioxygenase beta subunit
LSFIGGEGWRCRHIHFKVDHPAAKALTTQMYFEGDPLIEQDLEIRKAPAAQHPLLISSASPDRETGLPRYHFDIVLDRGV